MEMTKDMARPFQRVDWIDVLRGLMMFFVIYGHTTVNDAVDQYIYSFHMPIFFMLSGMTFIFNKETRIAAYLRKKFWSLFVPYVALNILVSPIWYWTTQIGAEDAQPLWKIIPGILLSNRRTEFDMPSNTTWFITCLILVDVIFFLIWKFLGERERDVILAVAAVVGVAYSCGVAGIDNGGIWHWRTAITALSFYLAGWLLIRHLSQIHDWMARMSQRMIPIVIGLFAVGFAAQANNGRVSMIRNDYNNIVLFYIAAFATSMAWVLVFIWLGDKKRFLKLTAPVREVGRYTLPYIAFQVALMRILRYYIPLFGAENELSRILVSVFVFFCFYPAARLIQIYLLPKGKWLHTHPARHRGERLRHAGH